MVIILNHTIAAAYLYFRDRGRFAVNQDTTDTKDNNMGIPDGVQEAILRLSGVVTYEQLEDAVKEALESALPNVSDVVVYLQTTDGQEMVSNTGLLHTLPKEGLAWEAVQQRQRLIVQSLDEADPLSGLLKTGTTHSPLSRKGLLCCGPGWAYARKDSVVCSPVKDQETDKVVAVFVVVCGEMSKDDHQHLTFLERQLLVCFKRLKQTAQLNSCAPITNSNSSSTRSSKIAAKNASILNLCAELYDHDAATLQQKVLNYLETNTKAQGGLLLLVDPEHNELCCQVIGGKVLEEEMRFSINLPDTETGPQIQGDNFAQVILTKHPITLGDIDQKQREELEEMVGWKLASMLAVPVISRATSEVVAIACMLNKQGADRFSEEDTKAIRHCFDYTAAVLHSTLAVQNERRLKQKTQTLLQVAKNLFTRLGEYIGDLFEESPYDKAINRAQKSHIQKEHLPAGPITRSRKRTLEGNNGKLQAGCSTSKTVTNTKGNPAENGSGPSQANASPQRRTKLINDKNKGQRECSPEKKAKQAPLGVDAVIEKQDKLAEKISNVSGKKKKGASSSSPTKRNATPRFASVLKGNREAKCSPRGSGARTRSQSPYDIRSRNISLSRTSSGNRTPRTGKKISKIFPNMGRKSSVSTNRSLEDSAKKTAKPLLANDVDCSPSSPPTKCKLKPYRLKSHSQSPERKASWETADPEASTSKRSAQAVSRTAKQSPKRFSKKLHLPKLDEKKAPTSPTLVRAGKMRLGSKAIISDDDGNNLDADAPVSSRTRHVSKSDALNPQLPGVVSSELANTDSELDLLLNSAFLINDTQADNITSQATLDDKLDTRRPKRPRVSSSSSSSSSSSRELVVNVEDVDSGQSHCLVYSTSSSSLLAQSHSGHDLRKVDSDIAWERATIANIAKAPYETPAGVGISSPNDLTMLLREIMQEARNLTKAERCSVFLLDEQTNELVAKVFDGDIRNGKEVKQSSDDEPLSTEVRIPADQGIAGHVATTGEILNIDDAYSHPLFYRGVDESTGFRTRNILCFPIKDDKETVIGVAQLCNKINGMGFSQFDMEIAQAFSIYCCISIVHTLMYQKVRDSQIRSRLASELMMYHMKVDPGQASTLVKKDIPKAIKFHEDFSKFCFTPRIISYTESPLAVICMFEEMGFFDKFRVPRESLANFVMMVRRGYRDPPYHNWAHAFAVGHFCYSMYKNLHLSNYLSELELFCLFVACLCHDIDHRGTTNSFQVASESVLAALYSSEGSVMERHHFAQTMCILNMDECNIFVNVSQSEYEKCLDLVRDIILATDLAHHLKILPDLESMAKGGFDKKNKKHKMNLLCLLMTSCDLSDQTKNWKNTKKIAELIYQEFFSQGDKEKTFGRAPMEMMDREKAYIPELQIGFLDGIAAPVFNLLADLFPEASEVKNAVKKNRTMWVNMHDKIQKEKLHPKNSMEVFEMDILGESDS